MARALRLQFEDALYHLCGRGNRRQRIFVSDKERIVVLEFPTMERAKEWLNCEEYREPRKMRHRTAKTNMLLVEGGAA